MNFTEALFLTMPGFTGFLLVLVLGLLFLTSLQKFRSERFEAGFWQREATLGVLGGSW